MTNKETLNLLKKAIKDRRKRERRPLSERIRLAVERYCLAQYEKIGKKAQNLRYKLEDPDNHEADQLVEMIEQRLGRIENRKKMGKELKPRHLSHLPEMQMCLQVIKHKQLGKRWEQSGDMLARIEVVGEKQVEGHLLSSILDIASQLELLTKQQSLTK